MVTVPYAILSVDADFNAGGNVPFDSAFGGLLAIVRRNGVPVGSMLFHGHPPTTLNGLLNQVDYRPDDPPAAVATPVRITVAVCTKDRPELLARCLASVRTALSEAGPEVVGDLVVVDNASSDQRTRSVAIDAGAICVRADVPGLDIARNAAVAAATGEVVAFIDDDVVVDGSWARTLARAFASRPDAMAVTGQVRALRLDTLAQVEFERTGGFSLGWSPITFALGASPGVPFGRSVGVGCNMAFRRDLFRHIGPFDDALDTGRPMPGGGDLDILVRTMLVGAVVYEPSALVFHDHRTDFKALRYQYYTWGKGYAVLLAKWYQTAPEWRAEVRAAARLRVRGYLRDLVRNRRSLGGHRRVDAALMMLGFATGATGSYGRSQRRMAKRKAAVLAAPPKES